MIKTFLVKLASILPIFFLVLNQIKQTKSDSWEYKLVHDVLDGYDSSIRPSVHHNTTLNVTFGLALAQLIDVDERNMIITTNCWLNQGWIDNKLKWDPDKYDGIEFIHIPTERIWKPDILLGNNADVFARTSSISTNAIVKSNGNVTWLSTVIFKSSCSINVRYFPFDEQVCDMIFASWTFDGFFLDINVNSGEGDITNYIKNGEWHLVKLLAIKNLKKYSCCEEPYPEIVYRLVIRRRPLYYLFNMVFPCLLITLVAFLGFYLPPGSTEKVSIGITTLLSITVFLMLVAESMPPTSEQLPLLSIYYAVTIGIVSCSTAMAVLTLNINNKGMRGNQVPKLVKIIFLDFLARILRTKLIVKKDKYRRFAKPMKNEVQSPLISLKKNLVANHIKSTAKKESISAESNTKSSQEKPNDELTDEQQYLTTNSANYEEVSKETKLNQKIDKLILEASDDYLISTKYQTQLDLIDSEDNFIYYVNFPNSETNNNSNNLNKNTNNNENKLLAKAINSSENQLIIKPAVKLDSSSSYNNLKTPTLQPSNNANMPNLPSTPVCQLHCICECSNNSNSVNDNRSNQSFQANCSNAHKASTNNNNNNNSKSNVLNQNNEDFSDFSNKKTNDLRRRSSQICIASNSSPRKHHHTHLHYHQNSHKKSLSSSCQPNMISSNFIHELEHLLQNQFNPLVQTIMNVVANNEKRMLEEEHQESIQNDWSNVAKVADHFLCYFFPFVTIATCLFIFLNSPHAFSQW